jgi:predicted nuclease of predicted toxin-antitoxin system
MPKFILDAQLPQRLKTLFGEFGFEAIHTLDLPNGNRTKDREIIRISEQEHRIVVTKDDDFVESYLLHRRPEKLLLLSCGNLSNPDLEKLFRTNLLRIVSEFESNNFIELNREDIIVHS